jgi:hypothetical protein
LLVDQVVLDNKNPIKPNISSWILMLLQANVSTGSFAISFRTVSTSNQPGCSRGSERFVPRGFTWHVSLDVERER